VVCTEVEGPRKRAFVFLAHGELFIISFFIRSTGGKISRFRRFRRIDQLQCEPVRWSVGVGYRGVKKGWGVAGVDLEGA